MHRPLHLAAVCFCAGVAGALVSSLLLCVVGKFGGFALIGVNLTPQLQPTWF